MTDDPVSEYKADWRRQDVEVEAIRQRLHRRRMLGYLNFAAGFVGSLLALATGVGYAVIAWKKRDVLFGLSALTLLIAYPPLALGAFRARRLSMIWTDRTPEGTLRYALAQSRSIDKVLRFEYWGGVVLFCFVGVVWACVLTGLVSDRYPRALLAFMSVIWILAATAMLLWVKWRSRRNVREWDNCRELLAKFEEAGRIESK
jgi:hypothetical protein